MKDYYKTIEIDGFEYILAFNLNVIETIQAEYGNIKEIAKVFVAENDEYNIKAIKFVFREMMNEGIEIYNDENGANIPLLTDKQVGRILTKIGMANSTQVLSQAISEATKEDNPKNA